MCPFVGTVNPGPPAAGVLDAVEPAVPGLL